MGTNDELTVAVPGAGVDVRGDGSEASLRRRREALLPWALCFLALRALVPYAGHWPPMLVRPAAIILFMLLSFWGPRLAAPIALPPRLRAALLPLLAGLSLLTAYAQTGADSAPAAALLSGYSDLFLIAAAVLLGQVLAGIFREPSILVPVAVVAAGVDYWGVNYGTTHEVLKKAPDVVSKLSVQVPLPGLMDVPLGIGFGDFVFFTVFLACAVRFGLRERLTFWLGFLFLLGGMAVVVAADLNVPALVPMAVAFLLANVGRFRFQRSEAVAMGYAALIIAALIGLVVVLRHG
ncbi:MAG: hypothetical protein HY321_11350 [Armatimonadetes bacterium]|nr:hypothetical protein [Armatimonadota bacterium]